MKQVAYRSLTYIRHHCTKFSRVGSQAPGTCTPLSFNIHVFWDVTQCPIVSVSRRFGVCLCFAWIWEQTATISLYSINWLVCITETQCVYCAVRTGSLCFVWIWEQTAIISLYSINCLVCITETGCVYCAVRTGCLNTIHINLSHQMLKTAITPQPDRHNSSSVWLLFSDTTNSMAAAAH
jgi:hypothetical protein